MTCSKRIQSRIFVYSHLFKKLGIINEAEFQSIMKMYPNENIRKKCVIVEISYKIVLSIIIQIGNSVILSL